MSFGARIITGLGWTAAARSLGQIVAWGVSIVVIRILNPEDYGLLAMAMVLIGFGGLFAAMGLGWAVVHAREIDTPTLRKVFGLVIVVNVGLFALVFSLAPLVAAFFGEDRLTEIIRVISIQFLVVAHGVIPDAMLQRALEFKWRSLVELSATIAGGVTTLCLALLGFGIWSLVYGSLFSVAWRTVGIYLLHPFMHWPSLAFKGVGELFEFGGYVAVSRVLFYVYQQADTVIGGRFLGTEQIGYYSVGMHLASLPMQRVSAILNEVAFPAFARIQDERERIGSYMLQGIQLISILAFPVFWGIAAVAPEIVRILLGPKWESAILPLQLLALVMPMRMVGQLMPPTLQGVGKAKLVAYNQLLACAILILAFLVGVQFGLIGLSAAWLAAFPVVFLINLRTWLPVLGLRARQLLGAMSRPAMAAAGMLAVVCAFRTLGLSDGLYGLAGLVLSGVVSYAVFSVMINRTGLHEVRSILRRRNPVPTSK